MIPMTSPAKLTDTQLAILSAASQRGDRCLTAPSTLKGGAAQKVAAKLVTTGLAREIKAKAGMEVWRRDLETGQAYSLKLTDAGLQAIAVDECSAQSMPSTGVPNTNDGASEATTGANVTAAQSATTPRAGTALRRRHEDPAKRWPWTESGPKAALSFATALAIVPVVFYHERCPAMTP
jgi:hypothetical protein